jgi:hypothetical protein
MNTLDIIRKALANEEKPLFTLAQLAFEMTSTPLLDEFHKFNLSCEKNPTSTIDEFLSKRGLATPQKLRQYAELYDKAGKFMAYCDQFYCDFPEYNVMESNFPVTVGRTDCQKLTKEQSGLGREVPFVRFATIDEAQNFIDGHLMILDRDAVERGDFFLDAPEDMVNPRKESNA